MNHSAIRNGKAEGRQVKAVTVHFIGSIPDALEPSAACGRYNPPAMTGETASVTCVVCRRTRDFRFASMPDARRTPALANYRKPVSCRKGPK